MKYIKYGHTKWTPKVDLYDKRQIDELIIKVAHSRADEIEKAVLQKIKVIEASCNGK